MGTSLRIELTPTASDELLDSVQALLHAYNKLKNPRFADRWIEPRKVPLPLHVFAYDPAGNLAGGMIGETRYEWLHVDILVVREELRGQGVGTRLMRLAERDALARGCRYAYVDTADYQAPEFYLKLGYRIVGRFDEWEPGHAKFLLTKTLDPLTT